MRKDVRCLMLGLSLVTALTALSSPAAAQQAIAVTQVQPVAPAVVGFTAERRGLFGWRTVYRPVVAPVASGFPVTTGVQMAPTVSVARPVMTEPAMTQPVVVSGFAPTAAPVTSFFAPQPAPATSFFAPQAAPVTSFFAPQPAPVTSFFAPQPAPVTSFFAPQPAPVTTVVAPAPVSSFFAPTTIVTPAPVTTMRFPVFGF